MNSINLRNILVLLMVLSLNTNVMAAFIRSDSESGSSLLAVSDALVDLSKTNYTQLRINSRSLNTGISKYYKVDIYELDADNQKQQLAVINSKVAKKAAKISFPLGKFVTESKTVYFDLYNTAGLKVDTYNAEFTASNLDAQAELGLNPEDSECDTSIFGACQLAYIVSKLNFNTAAPNRTTTLVAKAEDGSYTVSVPTLGSKAVKLQASPPLTPIVIDDNSNVAVEQFTGGEVSHLKIKGVKGKAPLVLSTASLLKDKVSGAIEFAKGKLYFTNNAGRKALATIEDVQQAQPSLGNYVTKIQLNKAIAAVPTGGATFLHQVQVLVLFNMVLTLMQVAGMLLHLVMVLPLQG